MSGRLAAGQREIARLLRAPEGVRAALEEARDAEGRALATWVRGDAAASAPQRLEIYANAVFQRLREALKAEFDALARCVGDDAFHDLAALHLLAHPSRHASLRWVGAALPGFLADHPAAAPFRRRWPWAADLARLEWALSLAFDAADAPALGREELARRAPAPEDWQELALGFQPSVGLLRLAWPVQRLLGADAPVSVDAPEPTRILVWRRDERPQHRVVSALEAALLERARAGACFGALCAHAADAVGAEAAPARVAEILGVWADSGLLAA